MYGWDTYILIVNVASFNNTITLKGTKREKLHAMHVKELIKANYSEQ